MARLPVPFARRMPQIRLEGERVTLRPPDYSDWRAWSELRANSREFLQPWEPRWPEDSLTWRAFQRRIRRYAADWWADAGYSFVLIRHGDEALIGGVSLSHVRRGVAETASIGYWTGAPHAGQGYMREGLAHVLRFAFDRLHLHRLEAACLPENATSRGLLGAMGFTEEGFARGFLCIDGAWRDHMLFGLLAEDWASAQPAET